MPPTISAESSPFIEIKIGGARAPVFIAHGVCGRVLFSRLAKQIETANPVYGIQAKGVDGTGEPFDCVEDMGRFYLEALERGHVEPPYILIGYSFGGLVALEMAQCLLRARKEVALLVLIDTYPHPRFLPANQRRRLFFRRVKSHIREISRRPLSDAVSYLVGGIQRRLNVESSSESVFGVESSPLDTVLARVKSKAYQAYRRYRPKFYPGNIKFVTAEVKTFFPEDPTSVWGRLVGGIEVDVIPGDHLSIVNKDFEPLGAVLTRYIRELDSGD